MNINDINNLKDLVYELEGLLELAQMREDKIPELTHLIQDRIKALADYKPTPAEVKTSTAEKSVTPVKSGSSEEKPKEDISPLDEPEDSLFRESAVEDYEEKQENTLRPIFCLNDHFRFRKTLFNGDESAFSSAMNMIAGMDSFDEAEAHFIDDLGWNPEDPEVADFLEILRNYFSLPR